MIDFIEGLDPYAGSNTMYGESVKQASILEATTDPEMPAATRGFSPAPAATPTMPKVRNRSTDEQDQVAKGRVEK